MKKFIFIFFLLTLISCSKSNDISNDISRENDLDSFNNNYQMLYITRINAIGAILDKVDKQPKSVETKIKMFEIVFLSYCAVLI